MSQRYKVIEYNFAGMEFFFHAHGILVSRAWNFIFILLLPHILNNYLYFCPSIWRGPDGPSLY
jgi:hypothetical protein